jgi:hypothetical protein
MRLASLSIGVAICLSLAGPSVAQAGDLDEIVRLPGQGQGVVKTDDLNAPYRADRPNRLVPGGGLMMSFDANADGRVSPAELKEGALAAFSVADRNEDGALTALEQQAWANSLPTLDDSLANPVRFDPNLDRMVSEKEFTSVVAQLAVAYADSSSGDIFVASLEAAEPKPRRQDTLDILNRNNRRARR